MQKDDRQNALLAIVGEESISSQAAIAERLKLRGFGVTQASVSRDLDELRVVKADGRYRLPATDIPNLRGAAFYSAGDTLIVAKCSPGLASAIAVEIDGASVAGIVGTIAGDDTIFIAVKELQDRSSVIATLGRMFGADG
ncbi:MAG: hypothetical protein WBO10_08860 [Pyrinomonadaceae bacterium]